MVFKRFLYVCAACMLYCFMPLAPIAMAADSLAPDATVYEFYKWYLHSTKMNVFPIASDRDKLETFVSRALIREIDNGAGMGADYFTKSQDDMPDWEGNIALKKINIQKNTATVIVRLGASKESYLGLSVFLKKENTLWKIRKIKEDKGAVSP